MRNTTPKRTTQKQPRTRRLVAVASQEPVIIEAATELFLERGYDGVSIDAINAVVGGSKRDIYGLFGGKEALFRSAVEKLATERADLFRDMPPCDDARTALVSVGRKIIEVVLSSRSLALHRLIVSEASRVPRAAEAFLANAPQRAYDVVAVILGTYVKKGEIAVDDPDITARVFIGALVSDLQLQALLGRSVGEAEQQARVDAVVSRLLDGIIANK
ncbi:TetR/AcrR family transcriptional regulator [Rhizobium leguminosarum]|uniref:TetR/AcrR family transcriptional regulator n=1 Tax=Rhizobium leguminosarum TaxID=384 RepID=UPI003F944857